MICMSNWRILTVHRCVNGRPGWRIWWVLPLHCSVGVVCFSIRLVCFHTENQFTPSVSRTQVTQSNTLNGHRTHMTQLEHDYLGNIAKPWNSASAGQSWNTILSFYHSRCETDASHATLEPGKHQLLPILNAYFPKEYHTPGPPRQRSRTIAPQAGVGRYCFRSRAGKIRVETCVQQPLEFPTTLFLRVLRGRK